MSELKFVVLTISDTCKVSGSQDRSGPKLVDCIENDYPNASVQNYILPDDEKLIVQSLIFYSDVFEANVIFTTGGTGFSKRDVTPEATLKVIDKMANGISTALTMESLKITPMAMVSRMVSGIRGKTLIINFPGSVKAVADCYNIVKKILRHSIDLLNEDLSLVKATHSVIQNEGKCGHHRPCVVDGPRLRESPYPMMEVKEALQLITKSLSGIRKTTTISVSDALGFVNAKDIVAEEPFPPFEASIKDGYACLAIDGSTNRIVSYEVTAGENPTQPIERGECVFINTGAPMPPGADCVVQIEDTKLIEVSSAPMISILVRPKKGQDVRKIGSDIPKGATVIPEGNVIRPAEIGLLATLGLSEILVFQKPKIGILSTGNELQPIGVAGLNPGNIRDSNKTMLLALFKERGFVCEDLGVVKDVRSAIKDKFNDAFRKVDILITTGGVSMGDMDFIKPVLHEDFKANVVFGRLNMKPGKPMTYATCMIGGEKKYVFALPGNPASALVTSQIIVIPSLMYSIGMDKYELIKIKVMLGHDVELDPRPHYARAILSFNSSSNFPIATLTGNQISSRLMNSSGADVLLVLPGASKEQTTLSEKTMVDALLLHA